jgi:hypothetical protein
MDGMTQEQPLVIGGVDAHADCHHVARSISGARYSEAPRSRRPRADTEKRLTGCAASARCMVSRWSRRAATARRWCDICASTT